MLFRRLKLSLKKDWTETNINGSQFSLEKWFNKLNVRVIPFCLFFLCYRKPWFGLQQKLFKTSTSYFCYKALQVLQRGTTFSESGLYITKLRKVYNSLDVLVFVTFLESGLSSAIWLPFWVINCNINVFENILVVIHQEFSKNVKPQPPKQKDIFM